MLLPRSDFAAAAPATDCRNKILGKIPKFDTEMPLWGFARIRRDTKRGTFKEQ
jgi:hypothetical protein